MIGSESETLKIVIKARDEASKTFKSVGDKAKRTAKDLRGIGVGMTAMGVGIGFVSKDMIDQAAKAEGSYAKFNTVFGEHSEDMQEFVKNIRKEMPTATSDIIRMSADLQDLLVPMGLTREKGTEMTKGFVDLANKVAAFNDVDPTQVLEAMKSGLSGSSEPLRAFGINALESALEAKALEAGLMDAGQSFKDLDPEVKAQVRAQALLLQAVDNSSDAINGFEENNDSFIRRQQDLNATITDFKEELGTKLLPVVDDVIKKIKPIVDGIMQWTEENKELTGKIVLGVAALGALMIVLGPLLIILPGLITAFGIVATVIGALLGPIGLVIAAIVAFVLIGKYLIENWDRFKESIKIIWDAIVSGISEKIEGLKESFKIIFEAIKNAVVSKFDGIKTAIGLVIDWIAGKIEWVLEKIGGAVKKTKEAVSGAKETVSKGIERTTTGGLGGLWEDVGKIGKFFGFQHGTDYVPATGLYQLHKGEAIVPSHRNAGGIIVNNYIQGGNYLDREAGEKFAEILGEKFRRELR